MGLPKIPVPEQYKEPAVEDFVKHKLSSIQCYLKCVALPIGLFMFLGSFAYFMLNSESTTIHRCDHNDGTSRYDCAEPHTEKVPGCDEVFIIGGYHGDDQNMGAEKYKRGILAGGDLAGGSYTSSEIQPLIVCVKNYDIWGSLSLAFQNASMGWTFAILVGSLLLSKKKKKNSPSVGVIETVSETPRTPVA